MRLIPHTASKPYILSILWLLEKETNELTMNFELTSSKTAVITVLDRNEYID
jgi:hypothetical protein